MSFHRSSAKTAISDATVKPAVQIAQPNKPSVTLRHASNTSKAIVAPIVSQPIKIR